MVDNSEILTEEDRADISYFIKEKGDITRWCDWEKKKGLVENELPHLIDALRRLDSAEKTLVAIADTLYYQK